jgi:hypothetical protein
VPKYKLVVLSSPVKGREEEYNAWYTNQHLDDVVAIPGFASAQRLKLHQPVTGEYKNPYLAIYEMDAEDPQSAMKALTDVVAGGGMFITESLDLSTIQCAIFEVCSPEVAGRKETTPA